MSDDSPPDVPLASRVLLDIGRGVVGALAGLFLGIAVFAFLLNGAPTKMAEIRHPGLPRLDREDIFQSFAIPLIVIGAAVGAVAAIVFGGKLWTQRIRYTTWGVVAGVALAVIGSRLVASIWHDPAEAVDFGRRVAPLFGFLGGAAGTIFFHRLRRRRQTSG